VTSFLITFKPSSENPTRGWPAAELKRLVHEYERDGSATETWRFQAHTLAHLGDRVFFLRQGRAGPAIIGYGVVAGPASKEGQPRVPIRFECLADPDVSVLAGPDELKRITEKRSVWGSQSSGISLSENVADALERLVVRKDESCRPHIDPYLFEKQFEAFKSFVEEQSAFPFQSFASNPYTENQEGYKREIYKAAREALAFQKWNQSAIGTGAIAKAAIAAIEIPQNNLVAWQARYGPEGRPHQPFYASMGRKDALQKVETILFKLYREQEDNASFSELVDLLGRTYPLIAYLFFLKDCARYLPIAPTFFDASFKHLGADFQTSHRCSWQNYMTYVALIRELKTMLSDAMRTGAEVSLLDAHSFAWMLAVQMERRDKLADVQDYLNLSASERDGIVKARIGQGQFRRSLINYWSSCAVTGCAEESLLRASHIKPWAKATLKERLSFYNGLLLSPALDACFDLGYVTFDDEGKILMSKRLAPKVANALGIRSDMRLSRIESGHREYLAFHRAQIFK
jgi:hypothetical protein